MFGFGLMGLCLAAANFAAILEGEEERFENLSKVLELFDLVDSCTEEGLGLPPVHCLCTGDKLFCKLDRLESR